MDELFYRDRRTLIAYMDRETIMLKWVDPTYNVPGARKAGLAASQVEWKEGKGCTVE